MTPAAAGKPLEFRLHGHSTVTRMGAAIVEPLANWLFQLPAINHTYQAAHRLPASDGFIERLLQSLQVRCDVRDVDLSRIPPSGPLIVVANHPFGGVDGLSLLAVLRKIRPDVRLLANHLLAAIPELREVCLFVDPFQARPQSSSPRNSGAVRAAVKWVQDGGVLGIFPAGEVSHLSLREQRVKDSDWPAKIGRLTAITGAPVLPVHFEGRNSNLFQLAGLVHPLLRTLLLPRETLKRRSQTVVARIGRIIPASRLAQLRSDAQRAAYLQARTHLLSGRTESRISRSVMHPTATAQPVQASQLKDEVNRLPPELTLARSGEFSVHFGRAQQIPSVLAEIGRLREITFRAAGEGTGRASDLDHFDDYYVHLFAWNNRAGEIAGAYRLGLTDEIVPKFGVAGLYTNTLFRFGERLMDELTPAIELGRSFVTPKYQREYAPLMLLWKGIGAFVAREPRYRRLFGTVSISNEYASLSRQLLMQFLRANQWLPGLARFVAPRNPPRVPPGRAWETSLAGSVATSIDDVDALVAEIESDQRGVPVLLRQYLKLGGKLLGFNIDHDFADVLDGLMLVDLLAVKPAILNRYLGADGASAFRKFHSPATSTR